MKKLLFLILPLLLLIGCEEKHYYFQTFENEKYECNLDGVDLYLYFGHESYVIYCPTSIMRYDESYYDMNTDDHVIYSIATNVWVYDVEKVSSGDLTGWYYSNLTGLKNYVLIKRIK